MIPEVPRDRTRGQGHTLTRRRVPLDIRRHFVTVRVTKYNQGGGRDSNPGDTQNQSGHGSGLPALGSPA